MTSEEGNITCDDAGDATITTKGKATLKTASNTTVKCGIANIKGRFCGGTIDATDSVTVQTLGTLHHSNETKITAGKSISIDEVNFPEDSRKIIILKSGAINIGKLTVNENDRTPKTGVLHINTDASNLTLPSSIFDNKPNNPTLLVNDDIIKDCQTAQNLGIRIIDKANGR
ncbi:MAG: hypothetical protein GY804_12105 [Alphaproteobacteria bacterium]|nr:hypothetical protein [Alphaproteobacteria bacterium]